MFCGIENANEIAGLEHLVKKTQGPHGFHIEAPPSSDPS
jgi:Cu/Zn superoxide dismutase